MLSIIPDICQFWYTYALYFGLYKYVKKCINSPKQAKILLKSTPSWKKYTIPGCEGCDFISYEQHDIFLGCVAGLYCCNWEDTDYRDYEAFAQLVRAGGMGATLLFCRFLRSLRWTNSSQLRHQTTHLYQLLASRKKYRIWNKGHFWGHFPNKDHNMRTTLALSEQASCDAGHNCSTMFL